MPPRKAPCEPFFAHCEHRISMRIKRPSTTMTTMVPRSIPCAMASTTWVVPRPKMKRILASNICSRAFTPERIAMVRNHPAPRRIRRIMGMRGSIAAGGGVLAGGPPGLSDMFAPRKTSGILKDQMFYCNVKAAVPSRKILRRVADIVLPPAPCGCDSVRPVVSSRPHGSHGMKHLLLLLFGILSAFPSGALAQEQREDEIVANLAGGRAIVHVAKNVIVFAAIDQPVERNSIPP